MDREINVMKLTDKVQQVLDSDVSGYAISKQTGITQTIISRLRKGQASVEKLSIESAEKIAKFYDAKWIDYLADGDEDVADIRRDMHTTFQEILDSQQELINTPDGTETDVRMYNVLAELFDRTLADNELVASLVPAYRDTSVLD